MSTNYFFLHSFFYSDQPIHISIPLKDNSLNALLVQLDHLQNYANYDSLRTKVG